MCPSDLSQSFIFCPLIVEIRILEPRGKPHGETELKSLRASAWVLWGSYARLACNKHQRTGVNILPQQQLRLFNMKISAKKDTLTSCKQRLQSPHPSLPVKIVPKTRAIPLPPLWSLAYSLFG
jgi:hypothetical protein